MSIIIPSKYIYELNNPKVRDNVYKKVEINTQNGVANNGFDVTVGDFTEDTSSYLQNLKNAEWTDELQRIYNEYNDIYKVDVAYAIAGVRAVYVTRDFYIDIEKDKSYVSLLKLMETEENAYSISLQCSKTTGTGTVETKAGNFVSKNIQYSTITAPTSVENTVFQNVVIHAESEYTDGEPRRKAESTIDLSDNANVIIRVEQQDNAYKVTIENILICYESYVGSANKEIALVRGWQDTDTQQIPITTEKYEPILMKVNFQGNTIGIDFEKETISIGAQASKNSLSIEGNELIQSTNIYYPPFNHYYDGNYEVIDLGKTYSQRVKVQYIYNGVRGEQYIAAGGGSLRIYNPNQVAFEVVSVTFTANSISEFYSNILDEYKNGKETATLTCTMSRYLDTNGEAVIDPAVYNVVDLNYFNGDGYSLNIDADNNAIIMRSHGTLDGVQMMTTYDGEPQAEQYADGRTYYKNFFTNKTKVGLRFTLHTTNREEDDYGITLDTSYLPDGNYSLSYELDIKDDVVTIFNLQINKGKVRPYQKPVKMHFSEGDIVIPMKYTSSGTDVGISLYNNNANTPKQFKVTGVEFFYDGVTRQKLTLQEV